MAEQFDNEMRGVLFKNKKKQDGDNRPNLTGKVQVHGETIFVSAWTKKSKTGQPFYSLALTPESELQGGGERAPLKLPPAQGTGEYPRQKPAPRPDRAPMPDDDGEQFKEDDIPF